MWMNVYQHHYYHSDEGLLKVADTEMDAPRLIPPGMPYQVWSIALGSWHIHWKGLFIGSWFRELRLQPPPPPTNGENLKFRAPPYGFPWIRHCIITFPNYQFNLCAREPIAN